MNEFEVLAARFLNCKAHEEWCVATTRAGQLVEQLIHAKKLDIDAEIEWEPGIEWGPGREWDDAIAFMVFCDRLEERYPDFPKNVEGIHLTEMNGYCSSGMSWEQRKFTYADVFIWLARKFESDDTEVETIAQSLKGIGGSRFKYLLQHPRGVSFDDVFDAGLTTSSNRDSIKTMMRNLSGELADHGYQIHVSIPNNLIRLEPIK